MNTRSFPLLFGVILLTAFLSGCAAERVRTSLVDRYAEIAAKIEEADTLGAREYSPRELAHARVELDHTLHEMRESYYSNGELQVKLDQVENVANDLLAKQRPEVSEPDEPDFGYR